MKFDGKHGLPHFITGFLLLILLGCSIWLIRNELERRKKTLFIIPGIKKDDQDKERKKPKGNPPNSNEDDEGKKEGNDDE